MLIYFIKNIFIAFLCLKIFSRLMQNNIQILTSFYISFFSVCLAYFTKQTFSSLSYLVLFTTLLISVIFLTKRPHESFIAICVSFGLSYSMSIFSSLLSILLMTPFYYNTTNFPYLLLAIITIIFQTLFTYLLLRIKRFQKGLPTLFSYKLLNIFSATCLFIIGFLAYLSLNHTIIWLRIIALFAFPFTLAFLIYWWQAQIKKAYLRKLEIQELESTRTQMAELKLLNQQLVEENTRLSRISHRDNTLITALKNTASQLLSTLDPESAEAISAGELLRNLETLSAERATMANESESEETIPFDTGYSLLDSVLNEMNVQAHRNAIAFSVHFGTGLDVFIPNGIAEIDLMHIVDDLLKNAFKSTLTKETRAVQLQFYKSDKHLVVEVADSGIPFEVESLINMGLERRTTYSDGSGIGLVEIWEAKEKYRATYHLEEYQNADPFTKRISIAFDKKNRYSIRTHRKAEILKQARRADLQVYSDTE